MRHIDLLQRRLPLRRQGRLSTAVRAVLCGLCVGAMMTPGSAAEFLLSDFNSDPFSYTFEGFTQVSGPQTTRLTDSENGWGAAVMTEALDLSAYLDGRFVVDLTPLNDNQVDFFQVNLVDADGLSGRWQINTGNLTANEPVAVTAVNTLSFPNAVYNSNTGEFVDDLPDLSRIVNWQIEGQWASPGPFDIELDNLLVSTTVGPPPPYAGYALDAPWRAEAATRIDQLRKADIEVTVVTASGQPVQGATVTVAMREHEYGFGSALQAQRLTDSSSENQAYRQKAAELFNTTALVNALKWPPWEGNWGSNFTHQTALEALDWAAANGLEARGHAMVWPAYTHLPSSMKNKLDEYNDAGTSASRKLQLEQEMRQAVLNHIADVGAATEGKVTDWDVINEIRANHDLMDLLGEQVMVDWFHAARAANPSADLYLNEYNILASSGNPNSADQQKFYDDVQYLVDNGAPIDGLGMQSHFSDARLTGPEEIWEILDRFQDFGLNIKITEFTHGSEDSDLQARFIHDFLTAIFAHESTEAFLTWGFSALDAAGREMFDENFDPLPNGQAFLDLVFDEWWSDEQATTDETGIYSERIFRGSHDITVEWMGNSWTARQEVGANGLQWTVVVPDPGDFDADGDVDGHDFLKWQRRESPNPLSASDFFDWQSHYGMVATLSATSAAVPEPTSSASLLLGMLIMLFRRKVARS